MSESAAIDPRVRQRECLHLLVEFILLYGTPESNRMGAGGVLFWRTSTNPAMLTYSDDYWTCYSAYNVQGVSMAYQGWGHVTEQPSRPGRSADTAPLADPSRLG